MNFLSTLVFHAINGGFWRYLGDSAWLVLALLRERAVALFQRFLESLDRGLKRCAAAAQTSYAAYVVAVPLVLLPAFVLASIWQGLTALWEALVELWETLVDLPVTRKSWETNVKRKTR